MLLWMNKISVFLRLLEKLFPEKWAASRKSNSKNLSLQMICPSDFLSAILFCPYAIRSVLSTLKFSHQSVFGGKWLRVMRAFIHLIVFLCHNQGFGSGAGVFAWIRIRVSNFSGSESGFNTRILGTKVDRNHSKSYLLKWKLKILTKGYQQKISDWKSS